MARLTSWQVQAADLVAEARFYGHFIGLELSDELHRQDGNEALHYDLAWGDFASGYYMKLHLEPGRHTTGAQIGITVLEPPHDGQWGRSATYENPDRNTISVTAARPDTAAGSA